MSDDLQRFRWLSKFLPNLKDRRLVVLTGARQTGKTTLVKHIYPKINYINLDAPENRDNIKQINSASWGKSVGVAVLDEAQKEPSVFEKIKFAYDSGDISFSVLLGSAQILLLHKIRESLAGRVFLFEIWPFMVSELLIPQENTSPSPPLVDEILRSSSAESILQEKPAVLFSQEEAKRKEAENHMLNWGGMPELIHLSDLDRTKWLKAYEYTYLERDLADLAQLKALEPFRKFQQLAALRSAKLLNYSKLARDAGISVDSARRYFEYLNLSYQTILLQPFHKNLTSSVVKSPKIYFIDIGILRQITGFRGMASGEIYETYVVSEIFKWIKTNQLDVEIYFYRTRSGLELDLLLKTEKGFFGIEIKSSINLSRADYSSLISVADKLKDKWLGGLCIYRGEKIEKLSDPNIWAVPSYRMFNS